MLLQKNNNIEVLQCYNKRTSFENWPTFWKYIMHTGANKHTYSLKYLVFLISLIRFWFIFNFFHYSNVICLRRCVLLWWEKSEIYFVVAENKINLLCMEGTSYFFVCFHFPIILVLALEAHSCFKNNNNKNKSKQK